MSTPDFGKHIKAASSHPPVAESPDIIKKDKIRDPVIEINENSLPLTESSSEAAAETTEDLKINQKVTLNPFLMDEAMTSLVEMSKM